MEFPGGPVVRTWHFHNHGLGSISGLRTKILQATWQAQKMKKRKFKKLAEILMECKRWGAFSLPNQDIKLKKVKTVRPLVKQLKIELLYDSIPLLDIYPQNIESRNSKRYLYIHVHNSIIHKSWRMKATQVSTDR